MTADVYLKTSYHICNSPDSENKPVKQIFWKLYKGDPT